MPLHFPKIPHSLSIFISSSQFSRIFFTNLSNFSPIFSDLSNFSTVPVLFKKFLSNFHKLSDILTNFSPTSTLNLPSFTQISLGDLSKFSQFSTNFTNSHQTLRILFNLSQFSSNTFNSQPSLSILPNFSLPTE